MRIDYRKILSNKEKKEVMCNSARIHWGFNAESIRELFKRYLDGDIKEKAKICYLLEDCNFHTLCGMLEEGKEEYAKKWIELEFPLDDGSGEDNTQEVEAWVMEGIKGNYLHINTAEDGDGTWWDWTSSIWDAYWDKSLDKLKDIAAFEFKDFEEGYPKYHKIKFTATLKETEQGN